MIGSTVPHNRILNKFGVGRRRKYHSRLRFGSLRQTSIKTLPDELDRGTEQLVQIKLYPEFLQLKEL